ncbi:MAG: inosine/xanthosine triphosphatase [Archaeoglobales archaeon]|nr:inosine/xanthosine triphosphatase [Archaeoglobi archaeon]NHW23031.1 inosine/xanthosine triphosphatase [Archaeoglobales archaeon]
MKVAVGSRNPTKIEGTRLAFEQFFEDVKVFGIEVEPRFRQPFNEETLAGAIERALKIYSDEFDFSVGIEAGLMSVRHTITGYMDFQVAVIYNGEKFTIGFGPGFEYPRVVVDNALKGIEVGKTMEKISGIEKIGWKFGAVHYLSKGAISRTELSRIAVTMALIPWLNRDLYEI